MLSMRAHRRLLTWLTLLSLGLGTLAPTLAHAVPRAGGAAAWVQVCSSTGMFWVRADGEAGDPVAAERLVACAWCDLHGGTVAPPPPGLVALGQRLAEPAPLMASAAEPAATLWLSPPLRGPPAAA